MKCEYERSILEEKLRLCKQKLKQYMTSDEVDQLEGFDATLSLQDSTMEDGVGDELTD
uniref:Uncharacterized protein n=1 Tax=Rhizophora mucronata TaxID=61149 RepID=A0A2P2P0V0_RHIMU